MQLYMGIYESIAAAVIQKHMEVIGKEIAISRARRVSGITVNENGEVKDFIDGATTVERLLVQYQELLGPAALSFARDAALPLIKQNPDVTLPASLSSP